MPVGMLFSLEIPKSQAGVWYLVGKGRSRGYRGTLKLQPRPQRARLEMISSAQVALGECSQSPRESVSSAIVWRIDVLIFNLAAILSRFLSAVQRDDAAD
jgi:hypothetical protein